MKKHVHKQHVFPKIKDEAAKSTEWLDFKSAIFHWDGVVREPVVPDPKDARIQELEKENREKGERIDELEAEIAAPPETSVIKIVRASSKSKSELRDGSKQVCPRSFKEEHEEGR